MTIVDESIIQQCRQDAAAVTSTHDLDLVKSKYLGGKSAVRESLKHVAEMDPESRKSASIRINAIKKTLGEIIFTRRAALIQEQTNRELAEQGVDTTRSAAYWHLGSLHPLTQTLDALKRSLRH